MARHVCWRLRWAVAIIGLLAVLGGCGDDAGDGEAAATRPQATVKPMSIEDIQAKLKGKKLTIGSAAFPNPSLVGLYRVADLLERDFGMEIELRLLDSAPLTAALLSGDVQVGHVSLAGLASAVASGGNLKAIAGDDQKNIFLVTAKDPITSIEQLKGKKVAISQSLTSIVGQTAAKCFKDAGLDIKRDTQMLQLDTVGSIVEALEAGTIDGGVSATFRQAELDAKSPGAYNVLCRGWEANPQLNDVIAVNEKWLAGNEAIAQAIAVSELKAARWARQDPKGWKALATEKLEGMTPVLAQANYDVLVKELDDWPVGGSLDRKMCDYTLRTSTEVGAIRESFKCDDLVTFAYQDAAAELVGRK